MRTSSLIAVFVFTSTLGGCDSSSGVNGDGGGDGTDLSVPTDDGGGGGADLLVQCIGGLTTITLAPVNGMVTLDGTTPPTQAVTATGTFSDGHTEALDPTKLAWTATRGDDTPPGMISAGTLTPNGAAGGTVTITATDGCVSGTTSIVFRLEVSVGTPTNPTDWTRTPTSSGTLPTVVYPSNETRFPRNIYRTLFQWRTGGYSEFRLTFEGPSSKVTIYTNGAHALCAGKNPAAGCFEADETTWSFIAASNAGQTVTWTLDAMDRSTPTPTIRRAASNTLGFSRRDVAGAIFYWSTTVAGVRRANIRDAVPENYIAGKPPTTYTTPTADQVKCVACHVVSRDGKYLAAPVQATSGQSLWITQVTTNAPPTPLVKSVANTSGHGFATISPDDQHVAVAWGGPMWTVDRATGVKEGDLPLGAVSATQPDWSPDNTQLVFATAKGDAPSGAGIAVIPFLNPGWGSVSTLVPAGGQSNLFPMFSPDGNWIAYSRGKGGHGDLTAQLWIVGKAGGTPVELINANRVVSNKTTNGQSSNTQPTWAPPGDLYWVAFNSMREYGVVLPAGTQQIWVAAVDPAKLATGGIDPSYPAFRLQFQGLNENNHRAFWTLDVRDPPPDGGTPPPDMAQPAGDMATMCIAAAAVCDPVLDTCCDSGYVCDSTDNGVSYHCISQIN